MRRALGYLLAWTAATAVAVAGSWIGLQPLLAATSADLPPSLEIQHLRDMTTWGPTADATPSGTPTTQPEAPEEPEPTESPRLSPVPVPPPQGPTSSTWEEVEDSSAVRRVFVVQGGEVTFEASSRRVTVVSHETNPGFEVSVNRWDRRSVVITFTSDAHTSRVWVQWRDHPYAEITESV